MTFCLQAAGTEKDVVIFVGGTMLVKVHWFIYVLTGYLLLFLHFPAQFLIYDLLKRGDVRSQHGK